MLKQHVNYMAKQGCCGQSNQSICYVNHSYVCKDPANWLPSKTNTAPGAHSYPAYTCNELIDSTLGQRDFPAQDWSRPWSCDGKIDTVKGFVGRVATLGCCDGEPAACEGAVATGPSPPTGPSPSTGPPSANKATPSSSEEEEDDGFAFEFNDGIQTSTSITSSLVFGTMLVVLLYM